MDAEAADRRVYKWDDRSRRPGHRNRYVANRKMNIRQTSRHLSQCTRSGAGPGSRELAASDLAQHEGSDAIYFPSPANRRNLSFWIWIDDCDETSITFADWHTHGSVFVCVIFRNAGRVYSLNRAWDIGL